MLTLESRCTRQLKGLLKRVSVPISSSERASRALAAQGGAHKPLLYHRGDDGGDDGGDGAQKKFCPVLTSFL
jgi:hypothetical protein